MRKIEVQQAKIGKCEAFSEAYVADMRDYEAWRRRQAKPVQLVNADRHLIDGDTELTHNGHRRTLTDQSASEDVTRRSIQRELDTHVACGLGPDEGNSPVPGSPGFYLAADRMEDGYGDDGDAAYEALTESAAALVVSLMHFSERRQEKSPPNVITRKATKDERRAMRNMMRSQMVQLSPYWKKNKGLTKQVAHKMIREATK